MRYGLKVERFCSIRVAPRVPVPTSGQETPLLYKGGNNYMQVQAPKGTKDVLPSESYRWQYLEGIIRQTCLKYGFKEVRTPVIEHTELF